MLADQDARRLKGVLGRRQWRAESVAAQRLDFFGVTFGLSVLLGIVFRKRTTRQMSFTDRRSPKFSIAVPGQPCRMR